MAALSLVRRTFGVMKANGAAHILSIGTIAVSFFLFAAFLLFPLNLASLLEAWEKKVQIILYLKDGVREERVHELAGELRKEEGIREVRYISQREAKESFERDLAGYGGVLKGVKEEIFPASFEIQMDERFRTPERIRALAARLNTIPETVEVQYGGVWLERFSLFLYTLKWGVWILGGVLVVIVMSVTSNTVRLTLYNKKGEIEILKLVGATDAFVKLPFYLEGGLQGLLGAGGAILLLLVLFHFFSLKVTPYVSLYFGELRLSFLPLSMIAWILGIGVASGLLGGLFSLRKTSG
jgi:cell division transport system permease protein